MSESNETLDAQERLLLDTVSGEFRSGWEWKDALELERRGLVRIVERVGDGPDDTYYEIVSTAAGAELADEYADREAGLRGDDHDA